MFRDIMLNYFRQFNQSCVHNKPDRLPRIYLKQLKAPLAAPINFKTQLGPTFSDYRDLEVSRYYGNRESDL